MEAKDIFLKIPEIGNLYIYDVLLSYIYPRVFVCEDDYSCKYIFYEMESTEDKDTWLTARLKKNDYFSIIDKKKSIQEVYHEAPKNSIFSVENIYGETDKTSILDNAAEWISKLPKEKVYAEKEDVTENVPDTLNAARDSGNATVDIHLYAGSERHSVSHGVMSELCEAFSAFAGSIFGKRYGDSLLVSTAPGSCIIRFSFDQQMNLQDEDNPVEEVLKINDILAADVPEEKLNNVKNKKNFVGAYTRFFDTIQKAGGDVQITSASPNWTNTKKIELSQKRISDCSKNIRKIFDEKVKEVSVKGELQALDTRSKSFKFAEDEGKAVSGKFEDAILDGGGITVPGKYVAKLRITSRLVGDDFSARQDYRLMELNPV